jgi:hypothetical protein
MFEILVNGNVVAIVVESVVKLFVNALINNLPIEMSIETRRYNPTPVDTKTSAE